MMSIKCNVAICYGVQVQYAVFPAKNLTTLLKAHAGAYIDFLYSNLRNTCVPSCLIDYNTMLDDLLSAPYCNSLFILAVDAIIIIIIIADAAVVVVAT